MTKMRTITPEFLAKLRSIKEFLTDEDIPAVISGNEVVFHIDGYEYRSRSLYETKLIVKRHDAKHA